MRTAGLKKIARQLIGNLGALTAIITLASSCKSKVSITLHPSVSSRSEECVELEPSNVQKGMSYLTCTGETHVGTGLIADADLLRSEHIKAGVSIAGIEGTLTSTTDLPSCSSGKTSNCLASASFPAIDPSALSPGDLRAGVSIAGVTGSYPSAEYQLDLGSATALQAGQLCQGFSGLDASGNAIEGRKPCITPAPLVLLEFSNSLAYQGIFSNSAVNNGTTFVADANGNTNSAVQFTAAGEDHFRYDIDDLNYDQCQILRDVIDLDHSVSFSAQLATDGDAVYLFDLGGGHAFSVWHGYSLKLYVSGNNFTLAIYRNTGGGADGADTPDLELQGSAYDDQWHHFTLTYDVSSFTYALHQDDASGVALDSDNTGAHLDIGFNSLIDCDLTIGIKPGYDDPDEVSEGKLDQLMLHEGLLTGPQVKALHAASLIL